MELSGADGYGYPPLLKKLAAKSGVPVECIVQAQGTSMANHLAMAALVEPGDEVLIEEPAYGAILATAEYLGAKIRRFPRKFESGFQLDPREVERNNFGAHAADRNHQLAQSQRSAHGGCEAAHGG